MADLRATTEQEVAAVTLEYSKLKAHIERYMEELQLDEIRPRGIVY
jgi:hypothetical protein